MFIKVVNNLSLRDTSVGRIYMLKWMSANSNGGLLGFIRLALECRRNGVVDTVFAMISYVLLSVADGYVSDRDSALSKPLRY